uniref:Uncharacterized protein n=1 Tax=Octopus bimaculoides TaxID=37653 RepID=A0A0L8HJS4_OCTBM
MTKFMCISFLNVLCYYSYFACTLFFVRFENACIIAYTHACTFPQCLALHLHTWFINTQMLSLSYSCTTHTFLACFQC